jgi:hypothetical protein
VVEPGHCVCGGWSQSSEDNVFSKDKSWIRSSGSIVA